MLSPANKIITQGKENSNLLGEGGNSFYQTKHEILPEELLLQMCLIKHSVDTCDLCNN